MSENNGRYDSWIVKLGTNSGIQEIDKITFSMYPNPTINELQFNNLTGEAEICIFDLAGQLVLKTTKIFLLYKLFS